MSTEMRPSLNAFGGLSTNHKMVKGIIDKETKSRSWHNLTSFVTFSNVSCMKSKAILNNQHPGICVVCYTTTFIDTFITSWLFQKMWYSFCAVSFFAVSLLKQPSDPISLSIFNDANRLCVMKIHIVHLHFAMHCT